MNCWLLIEKMFTILHHSVHGMFTHKALEITKTLILCLSVPHENVVTLPRDWLRPRDVLRASCDQASRMAIKGVNGNIVEIVII